MFPICLQKPIVTPHEIVNMSTKLLILSSVFIFIYAIEECPKEFNGLEDTCECSEDEVWCPNRRNEKVKSKLQESPPGYKLNCYNNLDENELLYYAGNVTSSLETSVIFDYGDSYCPIPKFSYSEPKKIVILDNIQQSHD